MLRVMVVYDIGDDRVRYRVSETCLDYGLDREQFSVFSGRLKPTHLRELTKLLRSITRDGQVMILPVGAEDWGRRVIIGEKSM
jgi:CRISPR-associated protein Cas2